MNENVHKQTQGNRNAENNFSLYFGDSSIEII
jgi:hypothetical protein